MNSRIFNAICGGLLFVCWSCGEPTEKAPDQQILEVQKTTFTSESRFNTLPDGSEIPFGMIFVPGGYVDLGSDLGFESESPIRKHSVDGFFMDEHTVTVAQYREFVEATGFKTEAEKFGDSGVFDFRKGRWTLLRGAYWEYPFGPDQPKAEGEHPVTQVSWGDAQAYAKWAGKRLPREVEWEHAARNGNNTRSRYAWGNEIRDGEAYLANFWQGNFPYQNTGQDGYMGPSPVGQFGKTELGLMDMAGNVWEWCADWFESYAEDGPNLRQNPNEPERVMRGGSYLCDPKVCHGFRVSGRSGTSPETGLCHLGFRCVQDIEE